MPVTETSGAEIHYETGGSGPLAVFVHGGLLDSRMWSSFLPLIAARRRWVTPDLRGFGRSSGADGSLDNTRLATDVATLVEQQQRGPADLVGLSLGGTVCAELAVQHPALVRSVCLISTSPAAVLPEQRSAFSRMRSMLRQEGSEAVARRFTERMLGGRTDPATRELVTEMARSTPLVTIDALYRQLADRPASHALLGRLTLPLLIVHGEMDTQVDPAQLDGLGPVRCVADAGHLVPLERPSELARLLIDFWSKARTTADQVE